MKGMIVEATTYRYSITKFGTRWAVYGVGPRKHQIAIGPIPIAGMDMKWYQKCLEQDVLDRDSKILRRMPGYLSPYFVDEREFSVVGVVGMTKKAREGGKNKDFSKLLTQQDPYEGR